MKKIIITGASGLIGNSLLDYLSRQNYSLLAFYNSNAPVIVENKNIKVCQLDIINEDFEEFSYFHADCLIHCAAIIPTSLDKQDLDLISKRNTGIDSKVVNFCKVNHIRLIYFSTVSIYENNQTPFKESDEVRPTNAYSVGKLNTERKIASELKDYVIFRISSPYGKFQKTKNVLKIFVDNIKLNKEVQLYGNGTRRQDFIHADDINMATLKAIEASPLNSVINIACGKTISMLELAEIILSLSKTSSSQLVMSGNQDISQNYNPIIDIAKASKLLNWTPEVNITRGLKDFFK